MEEGFDRDDRFRMVEDEFLDAAKQFTQHLHAAEYQKMKKAARSQNVATINSISRPITIRMPNETRRKVESVARAKKQVDVIQGLLSRKNHGAGSGEDSDDYGSAWLGTALHGLMESPRRSAASLDTVGKAPAMTRAAAGFHKPNPQSDFKHSPPRLAQQNPNDRPTRNPASLAGSVTESDDDDDLDAPTRPPKFSTPSAVNFSLRASAPLEDQHSGAEKVKSMAVSIQAASPKESGSETNDIPFRASMNARKRIAKRLEQARLREMKQKGEARKSKLDIIPTFLS